MFLCENPVNSRRSVQRVEVVNIFDDKDLERLTGRGRFGVEAEMHEDEDTYLMMTAMEFETAEELVNFYNQNLKQHTERPELIYGNSREVEDVLTERDTWASFRPQEESVREAEWAVDTPRTIERFLDLRNVENDYEETAKTLAAATFYTVSRAESDGEVGTGLYNFHENLIDIPGEEPIEIEVMRREPTDYDHVLSGNIDEVKEKVESIEDPDYNRLADEEEKRQDRTTLTDYFRRQQRKEHEDM